MPHPAARGRFIFRHKYEIIVLLYKHYSSWSMTMTEVLTVAPTETEIIEADREAILKFQEREAVKCLVASLEARRNATIGTQETFED